MYVCVDVVQRGVVCSIGHTYIYSYINENKMNEKAFSCIAACAVAIIRLNSVGLVLYLLNYLNSNYVFFAKNILASFLYTLLFILCTPKAYTPTYTHMKTYINTYEK